MGKATTLFVIMSREHKKNGLPLYWSNDVRKWVEIDECTRYTSLERRKPDASSLPPDAKATWRWTELLGATKPPDPVPDYNEPEPGLAEVHRQVEELAGKVIAQARTIEEQDKRLHRYDDLVSEISRERKLHSQEYLLDRLEHLDPIRCLLQSALADLEPDRSDACTFWYKIGRLQEQVAAYNTWCAERTALESRRAWTIRALHERDENGEVLYWSNKHGWVSQRDCDTFTNSEAQRFSLPIGGIWVEFGKE